MVLGGKPFQSQAALDAAWAKHVDESNEAIRQMKSDPKRTIGVSCFLFGVWQSNLISQLQLKPMDDDPTVVYYKVPESPYAVRVWDGSMSQFGGWLMDFFDTEKEAFGYSRKDIKLGEERYSIGKPTPTTPILHLTF